MFGVNLFLWTAAYTDNDAHLIPMVKKLGFDCVEIPLDLLDAISVDKTKILLEENELAVTGCAVVGERRDLISESALIRKEALAYFTRCLKMLSAWGGTVLCGPCYSAVGKLTGESRTQEEWRRAVEGLKELAKVAEDCNVRIAIEPLNRFETYFLNTAEDALRLVEEVGSPYVGVHLDTFHMNIEEKSLYQAIKRVGRYLFHVHTCENDRGTPGEGHVEWDEVFQALKEINYQGALVIESFVPGVKEIARAASIWRPLAPDSEYIARKGLEFLRKYWNG
ncbi:MAG: sugar phosphate isomerase/epimerase [Candidatus Caldatribacterium sp.]|uniref:sugar phosphate isomerase/epimerase family protein n=1 Tax=Candidatus Caldatribacterium sp. TaxID=2282143 RepID=UPI002992E5F8|nr:sugar phosphate isomerase/epimerase [Candidatus Caldatribacterium sp.]MCX7731379.1 sugar phosphate isomerase/epimerase [Candidatus Caldatribacterium sp.]MDW8081983.1 sugar phosphate isomerase/epimerase family protein [Candidatus Calescibacterium sp.]